MSEHGSGKDVTGAGEQGRAVQLLPMEGGWISPRCFVALDAERRGIGFLQEFADGSAAYWTKLLEIAKPARSLEAAFAALLRESSRDTDRPAKDPRLVHADPAVAVPLDDSFPWDDPKAVVAEVTRNVCSDSPGSSLGAAHLTALRGALSPLAPALEVPGLLGAPVEVVIDSAAWDCFDGTLDPGAGR